MTRRRYVRWVLATCGLVVLGCSDTGTDPTIEPIGSIDVSPDPAMLSALEATQQFTATVRDTTGRALSGRAVTWSSSDGGVASISTEGIATAVGNGTTTITAAAEGVTGAASLTVAQATASVVVTLPNDTVHALLDTLRASVEALDASGHAMSVETVNWMSSDTAVAAIDSTGLITTRAPGATAISATAEGHTGETTLTVAPPTPSLDLLLASPFTTDVSVSHVDYDTLEVRVSDSVGSPLAGYTVEFDTGAELFKPHPIFLYYGRNSKVDTTDVDGIASAYIHAGTVAGDAFVAVTVAGFAVTDTLRTSTLPGPAGGISIAPLDTALYVGNTFRVRAQVTDQWGNPRSSDTVSFTSTAGVSVGADSAVTGLAYSRDTIVAEVNGFTDTAFVSVVPQGVAAAGYWISNVEQMHGVVLFELDGSRYDTLYMEPDGNPMGGGLVWAPDASRLAFTNYWLYTLDTLGTVSRLSSTIDMYDCAWPEYSRDGNWVYFSGDDDPDQGPGVRVWRMASDGSAVEAISTYQPAAAGVAKNPTPSPDGTQLAVGETPAHRLTVIDLALDSVLDDHTVIDFIPRWSPTDDVIAFHSDDGVYTVHPDGTALTPIVPRQPLRTGGLSWSPDGQWLIYRGTTITIVNATTGLELPLAFANHLVQPAWRP